MFLETCLTFNHVPRHRGVITCLITQIIANYTSCIPEYGTLGMDKKCCSVTAIIIKSRNLIN